MHKSSIYFLNAYPLLEEFCL